MSGDFILGAICAIMVIAWIVAFSVLRFYGGHYD